LIGELDAQRLHIFGHLWEVPVPWKEGSPMSERKRFIRACSNRRRKIADICKEFGISEKTGYKVLDRYRKLGDAGLEDRSHAVLEHPFQITDEVKEEILALKRAHPHYGPRLIHDRLVQHQPLKHWPAASSIGELFKRLGLVRHRRRDHDEERAQLNSSLTQASEPNLVWTADFKGQFKLNTGFGIYCYPLTVMDLSSRFVLGIRALETTSVEPTKREFTRIFREYGLPRVIRTDNGVPFAQPNAMGRLGKLALWWVRLGIKPEHTRPGRPAENGAHERFHKTLKAAATKPASSSLKAQQQRFDTFITEYNTHRPHQSLEGRKPPHEFYVRSPKVYPEKLPPLIYPDRAMMRLVTVGGTIKWRNNKVSLPANLVGEYVGVVDDADDSFGVIFGNLQLGRIDAETNSFTPEVKWVDDT
jgi:putative transposase